MTPGTRIIEGETYYSAAWLDGVNDDCGSCGGDIGPSIVFPWHFEHEDCRAIREPISREKHKSIPQTNHVYVIHWRARDIGYGVEEGVTEAVYRGLFDSWGKYEWQPLDGSPTLYLFADEVLSIGEGRR